MPYATLEDLKEYIGSFLPTDTGDDDIMQEQLDAAQRIVDNHCRTRFEAPDDDEVRVFDYGYDTRARDLLFHRDCVQITAIINGDESPVGPEEYVLLPRHRRADQPFWGVRLKALSEVMWTYEGDPEEAIAVVGRFAYSEEPPPDIVHATLRLASWLYNQRSTLGDRETVIVTDSGVIVPADLPKDVFAILHRYADWSKQRP